MTRLPALLVPMGLTVIAAVIDARRREIPDWVPVAIAVCGVATAAAGWAGTGWASVVGGTCFGAAVGAGLFFVGGFGGGDAKLIAALGVCLGFQGVLWTVTYMGLAGGALAVVAKWRGRVTLAYGPAIAAGLGAYVVQQAWT